jgi:pyruvate/2-oxoglutarate dehydrogenase complex dihydrolipoamide acyltransferase (E2) component
MAPEQDWCLECGTAVTTRVARSPGWGVPVAIVVGVLAVAGAVLFVTIGRLDDDADKAAGGRSPTAAATPARTTASAATTKAGTTTRAGGPVPLWPRAKTAYTIVVATPSSRRAAEARARGLRAHGRDAGILRSDDYAFFGPGVWVVWRGKYPDRPAAQEAVPKVREVFPSAYVTFIRRET